MVLHRDVLWYRVCRGCILHRDVLWYRLLLNWLQQIFFLIFGFNLGFTSTCRLGAIIII